MQDDLDLEEGPEAADYDVRLVLTGPSAAGATSTEADRACREAMRKDGTKAVRALVHRYATSLLDHDCDQEKLALDAKRREEEQRKTEVALLEKGDEKERMAREQREKERLLKEEARRKEKEREEAEAAERKKKAEEEKAAAAEAASTKGGKGKAAGGAGASSSSSPAASAQGGLTPKAGGAAPAAVVAGPALSAADLAASTPMVPLRPSNWNQDGFHWEEKNITPWARERLAELLKGYRLEVPGGFIRVMDCTLKGDASFSMRKGKKLMFFDFRVILVWEGQLISDSGALIATGDGTIEIPDLDQDCQIEDYVVHMKAAEDGGSYDRRLGEVLQKHGLPILKEKVSQFVAEVKAKT